MKPNSYTQINIHLVFAVAKREGIIAPSVEQRLYQYVAGILKSKNHFPLIINGYLDHIHIFFELNPNQSLSDLVREIKSNTSKWINQNQFVPGKFQWQNGYGAFSFSKSQRQTVIQYIEKQKEHHRKTTFKEEYMKILQSFEIDFKNEYLFDFEDC